MDDVAVADGAIVGNLLGLEEGDLVGFLLEGTNVGA